jgi:hypothetical protein
LDEVAATISSPDKEGATSVDANPVPIHATSDAATANSRDNLNRSLSSAFFKEMRASKSPATSTPTTAEDAAVLMSPNSGAGAVRSYIEVGEDGGHGELPPPPPFHAAKEGIAADASPSTSVSGVEMKRRETVAAVNQMRDRLRGMGLLKTMKTTAGTDSDSGTESMSRAKGSNPSPAQSTFSPEPSDPNSSQILGAQLKEKTERCRQAMMYVRMRL